VTADDPASVRLVNALIGRTQAELAGRIDMLAEAQRSAVETSSREHAHVRGSIKHIERTLEALDAKVDGLAGRSVAAEAADAAIAMWRRRFLAATATAITLVTPLAAVAIERWLSG